jgi:chemotaxis response regulator CheB
LFADTGQGTFRTLKEARALVDEEFRRRRDALITKDEIIALIPSGSVPPYRPSADLLLTTLALAAGRRAVAVVLSGEGQDAATGATVVHRSAAS